MTKLKGWRRKAALIFTSEKTLGADDVVSRYAETSYTAMKQQILTSDGIETVENADKPRLKALSAHLSKVKLEFIGLPELCFYHATLIILLRRGYKTEETYQAFEQLWETETDFLLKHLSIRWIVSACDTFVDHATQPLRSAILMNIPTLINTLKVYETEKFLRGCDNLTETSSDHIDALYAKHLSLYRGLTYFRIGTDDTLKNMRSRYARYQSLDPMATRILLFVFDDLQNRHTAFGLLKSLHRDEKSQWWP